MDRAAVAALHDERIDWRFKGMPADAFGRTVEEFLRQRPTVFGSGFVGPLLVLDRDALEHNLRTMAAWCARHGVALAPHGKTTMAPQLFQRQLAHGAWGITAANLSQLRVYRAFGVSRVLLANQLVDPHGLAWLAQELDGDPGFSCACWVDSVRGVRLMTEALAPQRPSRPVDVLIELGAEGARTGVRDTSTAADVARAVAASPVLRLVGVGGYEGAVAHDLGDHEVAAVDSYMGRLRELVGTLAEAGHFDGLDEVLVTAGGSAYFDQVAEALTAPWPNALPVTAVLRSGAYVTHDDGLYRTMSPFGRPHRTAGDESPFRPAMRIWAQVTSRPEDGLALLTMGRRDVSFDQDLPEPRLLRDRHGTVRPLANARVTALADQHAFLLVEPDADIEVGDWIGSGLSHPCTVFDKWALIPEVRGDEVVDLIRTFF
ncbi:amino acid deaminase [Halopolyspora algeriensis]|nr:amino acid deaminase [Halopolyspora algeriensis]